MTDAWVVLHGVQEMVDRSLVLLEGTYVVRRGFFELLIRVVEVAEHGKLLTHTVLAQPVVAPIPSQARRDKVD
jgi:hypothetical protein